MITYTIDAENRTLGRVASEAAKALIGKNLATYVKNRAPEVSVTIINASKTKMSETRLNETFHERYSGQPGGFRKETNAKILEKKGWKGLYELAVGGMVSSNKLKPIIMKHLIIKD